MFFPPSFEGNLSVGSPLSPVLADNVNVRNASLTNVRQRSHIWIRFFLFWAGVLLSVIVIHYGS